MDELGQAKLPTVPIFKSRVLTAPRRLLESFWTFVEHWMPSKALSELEMREAIAPKDWTAEGKRELTDDFLHRLPDGLTFK